jgi:hypothetical protein
MVFADRSRGHSSQQEQERENKRDVLPRMPAVATGESDLEHCLESYTPASAGGDVNPKIPRVTPDDRKRRLDRHRRLSPGLVRRIAAPLQIQRSSQ